MRKLDVCGVVDEHHPPHRRWHIDLDSERRTENLASTLVRWHIHLMHSHNGPKACHRVTLTIRQPRRVVCVLIVGAQHVAGLVVICPRDDFLK